MYTSEREMVSIFKSMSRDFLACICPKASENTQFILEEFDSYNGIPDLVIGTFSSNLDSSHTRPTISKNWVLPLIGLAIGDKLILDQFSSSYSVTKRTAKSILESYAEAGFVQNVEKNEYVVVRPYDISTKSVVSIEGKLRNWKRALLQAQRYKRFSNLSFVLLDKKHATPALKNISSFSSTNIGLVTMDGPDFVIHYMPDWHDIKLSEYIMRLHEAAYSSFVSDFTSC